MNRLQRGFTLVELMVTVMIVGILAAVAYPSYQAHITKTHRNAAKACLSQYAQFMERYYTTNLSYAGANDIIVQLACRNESGMNQRYTFSVGTPTASAYTVTATPTGVQASRDTKCGTLGMTNTGDRTASGTSTAGCW